MDGVGVNSSTPKAPRLLEQVRDAVRRLHYSERTEETYVHWIKRFIYFSGKRHPAGLGAAEVTAFLNYLSRERTVAAATQNQALSALLFLYREVIGQPLPWLDELDRAKRPARVPAVLTRQEVSRLLGHMRVSKWLMASLLYGAGLRLLECLKLRVKDIDFGYGQVTVRDGKGAKDRVTMLPASLVEPLKLHLQRVRKLHERDVANGYGDVDLPDALARKYSRAPYEWAWKFCVSVAALVRGSAQRGDPAAPCVRELLDSRGQGRGRKSRDRQARDLPYVAPLVRHAPARGRVRHPHGAGAAGARRRVDHHDLYARAEQGRARGGQPAGRVAEMKGALARPFASRSLRFNLD